MTPDKIAQMKETIIRAESLQVMIRALDDVSVETYDNHLTNLVIVTIRGVHASNALRKDAAAFLDPYIKEACAKLKAAYQKEYAELQ